MNAVARFMLGNRTWGQIVLKNAAWTFVGEGVSRILKFAVTFLIVREFGPTDFGKFAFAFAVATVLSIAFDAGMVTVVTREYAKDPAKSASLPDMLGLKLAFGSVVMLVGVGLAFLVTDDRTVTYMIVVLTVALFAGEVVNLGFAVIRARQRMELETIVRVAGAGMLLFVVVGIISWPDLSISRMADAYLIAGLVSLLAVAIALGWRPSVRFRPRTWWPFLRIALPLALSGAAMTLYVNMDAAMLGFYGRITEAGWYGAAIRVNGIMVIPMSIMGLVLFPALSQLAGDRAAYTRRWSLWVKASSGVGLTLAIAVMITADLLVRIAFGAEFAPAAGVLRVTIMGAALMYVYFPWLQGMILADRQVLLLYILSGAAMLNAILNMTLIPSFGMYGAAWATVATHAVILVALVSVGRGGKR